MDRLHLPAQCIADDVIADPRLHRYRRPQPATRALHAIRVELAVDEQRDFFRRYITQLRS